MTLICCPTCKGTGYLTKYPTDARVCDRCKGAGGLPVHPTAVLGYGCNRCQETWDKPLPPYCPTCGADATHYRTA